MFDIDGVLNEHGGNIVDSSKQAIQMLREHGLRVCFASGKHAWYIQGGLVWSGLLTSDTVIVAENGGVVYSPQTLRTARENAHLGDVKLLRSIFYNLYSQKEGFVNFAGLKVWEEPKETLFCLFPEKTQDVVRLKKLLTEIVEVNKFRLYLVQNPDSVDVLQQGINKETGIRMACEWMDVDMAEVIAFGDSYNDLEMLSAVGFAVTLKNGKPEIKEVVDKKEDQGYIAALPYGDGVLEAVKYLIKRQHI